jgi:hypothetical protein
MGRDSGCGLGTNEVRKTPKAPKVNNASISKLCPKYDYCRYIPLLNPQMHLG